jgi:hypothetical protein
MDKKSFTEAIVDVYNEMFECSLTDTQKILRDLILAKIPEVYREHLMFKTEEFFVTRRDIKEAFNKPIENIDWYKASRAAVFFLRQMAQIGSRSEQEYIVIEPEGFSRLAYEALQEKRKQDMKPQEKMNSVGPYR